MDVDAVEIYIGYTFRNKDLLEEALNPFEYKRLGFLGDKVVGLLVLDDWYRTRANCARGYRQLQRYASNRAMASEARRAHFDQMNPPGSRHYQHLGIHGLATEVEAVVGAVWIDSERDWVVTDRCYARIKG
ncbi:ribonuclease III domain-containing protein [Aspergillus keveii]|uniref:Ribonuclease III domain-containing protein n=1 Tax=Aspergillus keveii TaxID=714993 RepID=A0ABR4G576_9EURO